MPLGYDQRLIKELLKVFRTTCMSAKPTALTHMQHSLLSCYALRIAWYTSNTTTDPTTATSTL